MDHIRSMILCSLLFIASAGLSQDKNMNDCITKTSSEWGAVCDKCENYKEGYKRSFEGTYQITLKNVCSDPVELKVAMQEKNGRWRTFPIKMLAQNDTMTAFACKGSGRYLYWVKGFHDTELILPTDREIISQYQE